MDRVRQTIHEEEEEEMMEEMEETHLGHFPININTETWHELVYHEPSWNGSSESPHTAK